MCNLTFFFLDVAVNIKYDLVSLIALTKLARYVVSLELVSLAQYWETGERTWGRTQNMEMHEKVSPMQGASIRNRKLKTDQKLKRRGKRELRAVVIGCKC